MLRFCYHFKNLISFDLVILDFCSKMYRIKPFSWNYIFQKNSGNFEQYFGFHSFVSLFKKVIGDKD